MTKRKKRKAGRKRPAAKKTARLPKSRLGRAFYWLAVAAVWIVVAGGVMLIIFSRDLPDLESPPPPGVEERIEVRDQEGGLLGVYGAIYGESLSFEDIPPVMVSAILAVEDQRFFEHGAFDLRGIVRAALVNLRHLEVRQGASTITQQLAKNLFLSRERTWKRKVQELLLALGLERRYAKQEILALYLNRVYFGAGTYGVDAAARKYFGHSARTLSLAEAALLAGLVKAPSNYSPLSDRETARGRAEVVLAAMAETGAITLAQAEQVRSRPAAIAASAYGGDERYFTDWVVERLPEVLPQGASGPFVVYTTLDSKIQRAAAGALRSALEAPGAQGLEGAAVVLSPDGAVKGMAGGKSYATSQFNRAAHARRQPGSAFKVAVYLAAFEAGFKPSSEMVDEPVSIGGWAPENFERDFQGEITLRDAFAYSINTVAVKLSEAVGRGRVAAMAKRLGFSGDLPAHPSLALGVEETTPLELASVYATIAAGGARARPFAILEVRSGAGALVYRHAPPAPAMVLEKEEVRAITGLLSAAVAYGTGKAAAIGRPAAGKTGTSQDYRDAWFAGFSADYVGAVWVGNDDDSPMPGITGGTLPVRIWARMMEDAHKGLPPRPLPYLEDRSLLERIF